MERGDSASAGAPATGRLKRGAALFGAGFLVIAAVLVVTLIELGVRGQNELAIKASIGRVEGAILDARDRLGRQAADYGWWDEAIENLIDEFDPEWAEDNVGRWVHETFGVSATLVFGPGNETRYAVHDAEPIDVAFEDLGPLFADMAAQARSAGMADAVPVDGLLRWRGAVYAVGLTAMTRQEPSAEALQPHPRPILAFLTRIDRPFLGDLAQRMQISEFIVKERIDPNCNAWLPLVAANGETVGGIGWIAPQPGASLYEWVIVPVLLAFAALGLLVTLLIRRTLRIAAALESTADGLRRAERDARAAESEARTANAAKSRFLASVSHELRSPLHAIIGFASFLKDQKLGQLGDPRYVDYARQIHEGGQSLHQIVDDLIDYTRLDSTCAEAGGQADAVPVDFAYILEVVARGLTPRAEEKGVALDWSAPAAMAKLRGDERGLRQLLRHLIDNAIKFTPSGGSVQATLEQVPRPGAGTMVRLEVRDSGLGMEPVMIDQMLAPFTQADADIDRRHGGLGIGLALVRVLLRKHEATLEIDSAPMEGTRFVVTFPPQRTVTDEPRPIDGLGESA